MDKFCQDCLNDIDKNNLDCNYIHKIAIVKPSSFWCSIIEVLRLNDHDFASELYYFVSDKYLYEEAAVLPVSKIQKSN
jgi:hypothetical protein